MEELETKMKEIIEELTGDDSQKESLEGIKEMLSRIKHYNPTTQKRVIKRIIESYHDISKLDNVYINCKIIGLGEGSFSGEITDEYILMANTLEGEYYLYIEDMDEIYQNLESKIQGMNLKDNFSGIMICIQETIDEYYGKLPSSIDSQDRFSKYVESDDGNFYADITSFKNANAACCTERAALAQNLLCHLGIDSRFVQTRVINNSGKQELHNYNLIAHNGKYFIFDSTMPSEHNGKTMPIICEITKEQYDIISCDYEATNNKRKMEEAIEVNHFNPLQQKEYNITYASDRIVINYGQQNPGKQF